MADVGTDDQVPEPGLYVGRVMHQRLRPFRHRFVYRIFSLLVDLDRLYELDRRLRLLAVDGPGLFSLQARDHGPRDGSPLRPWVERHLLAAGLAHAGARIMLLAFPRVLGYAFNPLSIYFCYAADGRLGAVLHEVKNTFGGQRAYVLPATATRGRALRQSCVKDFFVSPFIDMAAGYRFKIMPPDERLSVVIQEEVAEGTQLVATLTGTRRALTDTQLLRCLLRDPAMTYKVIAGIHWEALRLWWKGARLRPWPADGRVTTQQATPHAAASKEHPA